jgi:3-hydroxyacyl-CoA dehydrogenase
MSSDLKTFVTLGNLEDDFAAIAEADLVIEAIIENLKIKQDLMNRIDKVRKPTGIIATNTSGIPIKDIAAGMSEGFKQHFLGMHFFNPPRYLKLLEVIPTDDTMPEVVEFVRHFGEFRLGKGIVLMQRHTQLHRQPGGFGTGASALDFIIEQRLQRR